jgi:secreted PhoX family phosphatase
VFKDGLRGADPNYDYGTHFLFQGHETGSPGYITRINLDADGAHRVTLLAWQDSTDAPIADIDGSTWDPWAQKLLFTTENTSKPTYAATPGYPSTVTDVSGALGRGGYEGIQNDSDGNVWIVEDVSGAAKGATTAKRPSGFLYRYVPATPGDLTHGKLEALQVLNAAGDPITFASQAGLDNADSVAIHTYGTTLKTKWIVIHDTATDPAGPFVANDLAKANGATPFKRPENGQFRPSSKFTEFYFDETGDTNATSPENDTAGGWGSVLKLTQPSPSAQTGTLSLFYKANQATAGFDNVTFLSKNAVTFVQDAGDTLHAQANALDSGFVFDVTTDYSQAGATPLRWLAEGRDASATLDSANGGFGVNEGDNEITGVHVSDGDPTVDGILGAKNPELNNKKWRWFYTQQHGDNPTYEVTVR